jgi:hypothetical protein
MFNFSANNLTLLSRTECRSCLVFVMKDHHTQRVYRLYDFTKSQEIAPDQVYCVFGKVNSADKLYLVIESVRMDTKSGNHSKLAATPNGAGRQLTMIS